MLGTIPFPDIRNYSTKTKIIPLEARENQRPACYAMTTKCQNFRSLSRIPQYCILRRNDRSRIANSECSLKFVTHAALSLLTCPVANAPKTPPTRRNPMTRYIIEPVMRGVGMLIVTSFYDGRGSS
eukprot:scaffold120735_cov45-Attheya_sp.AAC.7